jgi:sigma-E factor negative regulatory protein RseC
MSTASFATTAASGIPTGVVIAIQGSRAEVSTSRRGACAGCAEASTCDLGMHEGRTEIVAVENPVGARPGDTVELDLPGNAALKLSVLVWVLPLLGLVGGALIGATLSSDLGLGEDGGTLLGALTGAALVFTALRRFDRRAGNDQRLTPYIARVVRHGAGRAGGACRRTV